MTAWHREMFELLKPAPGSTIDLYLLYTRDRRPRAMMPDREKVTTCPQPSVSSDPI